MDLPATRRRIPAIMLMVGIAAAAAGGASGQETKRFSSSGTSFEYPAAWTFEDTSTAEIQQLGFYDKTDDAVVQVTILKKRTDVKLADLKKQIIDPWVEKLVSQYQTGGVALKREPTTDKIGEFEADGIKFSFVWDDQLGAGQALWSLIDKHLVLLYFMRPDKTAEKATAGYEVLRKSLSVSPDKK